MDPRLSRRVEEACHAQDISDFGYNEQLFSESHGPTGSVGRPTRCHVSWCYWCASDRCRSAAARVEYSSFSSVKHCVTSAAMR